MAQDQSSDREMADRLASSEGLPSAEAAAGLIRQLLEQRMQPSMSSAELLHTAVQRCVELGEHHNSTMLTFVCDALFQSFMEKREQGVLVQGLYIVPQVLS